MLLPFSLNGIANIQQKIESAKKIVFFCYLRNGRPEMQQMHRLRQEVLFPANPCRMNGLRMYFPLMLMDIDLLSKMVADLILERDEVALPGVGVFVAEIVPASFSDRGYTINPPYRRLSFRQREGSDDSLIELYSRTNGIGKTDAERLLLDFLDELKSVLTSRKTIIFPGLGRLRATRENHFFFVPDESLNIYPEGFGLQPLSLKFRNPEEDAAHTAAVVAELASTVGAKNADGRETQQLNAQEAKSAGPEEKAQESTDAEPVSVHDEAGTEMRRARRHPVLRFLGGVIVTAALLLAALAVTGRIAPRLVDTILYTAEERALIWN